jgi:cytochrome c oxidase subunit 2
MYTDTMEYPQWYRATWTYLFQDSRSPIATAITNFHSDVMVIMLFVVGFVLWALLRTRYLRSISTKTYHITHGATIEIIWTIIPRLVVASIAVPSWTLLYSTDALPTNGSTNLFDMTLKVIGRQWYWIYEYGLDLDSDESIRFESYMVSTDELQSGDLRLLEVDNRVVVPRNRVIRVLITGGDVIHSWTVPSLGVKCDAIPGRLNQVFFLANREGVYTGQCSELCGAYHRFMPIVVERVSLDNALTWLSDMLEG